LGKGGGGKGGESKIRKNAGIRKETQCSRGDLPKGKQGKEGRKGEKGLHPLGGEKKNTIEPPGKSTLIFPRKPQKQKVLNKVSECS